MPRVATFLLSFLLAQLAGAAPAAPAVKEEIDALLSRLEASGCRFNRNGDWHGAGEAKAHLLRKLEYLERRRAPGSTEEFIELAASKSSISGEAYLVQCGDGVPVASSAWLSSRLHELRSSRPLGSR